MVVYRVSNHRHRGKWRPFIQIPRDQHDEQSGSKRSRYLPLHPHWGIKKGLPKQERKSSQPRQAWTAHSLHLFEAGAVRSVMCARQLGVWLGEVSLAGGLCSMKYGLVRSWGRFLWGCRGSHQMDSLISLLRGKYPLDILTECPVRTSSRREHIQKCSTGTYGCRLLSLGKMFPLVLRITCLFALRFFDVIGLVVSF